MMMMFLSSSEHRSVFWQNVALQNKQTKNQRTGTKQISSINIFIIFVCIISLFISLKSAFANTLHTVLFSFNLSAVIFSFICMLVLWLWARLCYSQCK